MKPILFNTEMVKAILSDRKTVTRRVVKLPRCGYFGHEPPLGVIPPCRPGDVLYVRETWAEWWLGGYVYKADDPTRKFEAGHWAPSIHMPKEAARLFLWVTDVRVERLQTPFFSPGTVALDCHAEGIDIGDQCRECIETYGNPPCISDEDGDDESECECGILDDIRDEFAKLWDSTIKPADLARYGWDANPWVWVVEFERISKKEAAQ